MITEKRLAVAHNGFWNRLLPMAPAYLRKRNLRVERFAQPMRGLSDDNRGLINEVAFRLFVSAHSGHKELGYLSDEEIDAAASAARDFISRFREFGREPLPAVGRSGLDEAIAIGNRIMQFLRLWAPNQVDIWPRFPGCGIVDDCCGDLLIDQTICEVKSGIGAFRGRDIRQILCYAALNFAAKKVDLREICLVNPREGVSFRENLEALCWDAAGASSSEVLSDIVDYISQPFADAGGA